MSLEQSNQSAAGGAAPLKGTPGRLKAKLGKGDQNSPAPKSGGAGGTQAAGASPASMTVKRTQNAQNLNQELAVDLAQWFARVNPNSKLGGVTDADQFFVGLQTGVELCDIVNIIAPEYKLSVARDAKPKTFQASNNIESFLKAARSIGVAQISLFETEDLAERKSDKLVINTLLQLSDAAADQFATPKPDISPAVRAQFASTSSPAKQLKKSGGSALPATKETPTKAGATPDASALVDSKSDAAAAAGRIADNGSASLAVSTASVLPTTSVEISEASPKGAAALNAKSTPAVTLATAVAADSVVDDKRPPSPTAGGLPKPSTAASISAVAVPSSADDTAPAIVDEYTDVVKSGYYVSDGCAADGHSHAKARAGPAPGQPSKCAAKVNSSNDFADSLKVLIAIALTSTHLTFNYLKARNGGK